MKKLTTEEFIEKAKLVHGNKYDYSKVDYINSQAKVKIICEEHGEFEQKPNNHLTGYGCSKCSGKNKLTTEEFIEKAKLVYGDKFDYSKVNYVNNHVKIIIICPIHGEFLQIPNSHLAGLGCQKCAGNMLKTNEKFIAEAKLIHNDKYDYSQTNYINGHHKVKIICARHGEFWQLPSNHLKGGGCPNCQKSKGENNIKRLLNDNNISFIPQYKFNGCINKKCLPFDFYLPEHNICIEFQGIQHYQPFEYFGGEKQLKYIQTNDNIKRNYCKKNQILLIEIKYNENIKEKLKYFKILS